MSYLGTVLELDEGSRLTGVGLRPLARDLSQRTGTTFLHVVMLPTGVDATAASGAAATFMPATIATINGNQPDGTSWLATFQFAAEGCSPEWAEQTADASTFRALNLIGLDARNAWSQPLTADDLRSAYDHAGAGDVGDWPISDLLTGLLVELTNTTLAKVVADSFGPASGEDEPEVRRTRLHQLLASWAATYEGPTP